MQSGVIELTALAKTIDHSLLRPDLAVSAVRQGCALAREYDVVSVCARPTDLPVLVEELAGTGILVTTTVGFPHGVVSTAAKVAETRESVARGAVEVDMVLNVGKLRSGEVRFVEDDLGAVVEAAHAGGALAKVIFENFYLSTEEKLLACRLAEAAGADFVKTSTGFAPGGATVADVELMRRTCSPRVRVKAAGGLSTLDTVLAVIAAGAVRVGTSSTRAILDDARKRVDAVGSLRPPTT
ncbi:MAG TPA: deoxyribose-phosphate aldolase [Anaeromyxobacter sp.]|nr:deoxyribose-phosphate aldolase [Anaeromyxobacter sp.]HVP59390.1 deoxyribose-phosphate aldolase [Myxococcaceae bacterium]